MQRPARQAGASPVPSPEPVQRKTAGLPSPKGRSGAEAGPAGRPLPGGKRQASAAASAAPVGCEAPRSRMPGAPAASPGPKKPRAGRSLPCRRRTPPGWLKIAPSERWAEAGRVSPAPPERPGRLPSTAAPARCALGCPAGRRAPPAPLPAVFPPERQWAVPPPV